MGLISVDGIFSNTMALSAISPPSLAPHDVHLWFTNFRSDDIAATEFDPMLDSVERQRAERFIFAHHRERFIRAHGFLRLVLAHYARRNPAKLTFTADRYGKPELTGIDNLAFSLSHAANGVAIGVTKGHAVGIDIEAPREANDRDDFVQRFFSPSEIMAYQATEPTRRERVFFRLWTRKEAFLKGIGLGLSRPLDTFAVGIDIPVVLHAPDDPGWSLHHLDPGDDFVGAVACSHPSPVFYGWRVSLDRI